jgi:glutamate synthase (NADPH/NADH) large chain
MSQLAKHARSAIADYDDAGLATLVANKRLSDFKRSLSLRNILSMDSPGTYGWILFQSRKNREQLGHIPSFEELFAKNALPDIAAMAERSAS